MSKVITFGEIMLRLAPEGYKRFVQADKFDVVYGGAESNVAVSLANFDVPVSFVTKSKYLLSYVVSAFGVLYIRKGASST